MARARIRVTLPDGRWKSDVTSEFEEILFRLPSTTMSDGKAVEVVVAHGNMVETCLSALQEHPDVSESIVVHREMNRGIIQIRTTDPVLLNASNQAGAPLMYPLEVYKGDVIVDVVSTHNNISEFRTQLTASDVTFEVEYVQQDHAISRNLTERQREVLLAAVEHGYYGTPRECTLTELADEIDIAKSSCCGMLQRIENIIVKDFLQDPSTTPSRSKTKQTLQEIKSIKHSSSSL